VAQKLYGEHSNIDSGVFKEMFPKSTVKVVLLFVLILCMTSAFAKNKHKSESAKGDSDQRFTETAPPTGAIRPVAEFEPASHVLIRYPLGIPVNLVAHLSNTAQVICIVSSASVQNQATTAFNNGGVNMANVTFMIAPTDSYWTRDFGPWFIFNNNQLAVVDFQYNRPRPNDNMIPYTFAQNSGLTYYGMNLQQTGGNYMCDGIRSAAQTQLVYEENTNLSQTAIGQKMQQYLGVTNYMVINDPNNTYIDHIDCWGKFLAPDKVLIRSVPTTHAQYNAIEQVANYFAQTNCAWGYPYKVYRVNTPGNQPYTNSLILNKKVFVPIMGGSYDAAALAVYRQALPGYEVIGITGASSTPWESTDALHCRTHEIPDRQMLYIEHTPYHGTQTGTNFSINAKIHPYSQTTVYPDSVFVSYKVNQGAWQRSLLTYLSGDDYTTMLSGFAEGDTIRYFIHGADLAGKSNNHPLTAAYDPHLFVMAPDMIAPTIQHTNLQTITNQTEPVLFTANVSDNNGVSQVFLRVRIDEQASFDYPMEDNGNGNWSFSYVTDFNTDDDTFYYQIKAIDSSSQHNTAYYPTQDTWVQVPISTVANVEEQTPALTPSMGSIYPNPFNSSRKSPINIEYSAPRGMRVKLVIFNIKGQIVYQQTDVATNNGNNLLTIQTDAKSRFFSTQGVYLVQLTMGNDSFTKKIAVAY